MKRICFLAIIILLTTALKAQDIAGQWIGTMKVPGAELRVVFNVKKTNNGYVTCLDSPNRGLSGLPMSATLFEQGNVTFQGQGGFRYTGKLIEDDKIEGGLEEGGQKFPVVHSEGGGMIATIVASRSKDVKFIVSLAGIGVRGNEILLTQQEAIARDMGVADVYIQRNLSINKGIYDIILADTSMERTRESLTRYLDDLFDKDTRGTGINKEDIVRQTLKNVLSPWLYNLIKYNPAPVLKQVKCPVLALNGSKDLQVLPRINLDGIRKGLAAAGNRKVTIKELPGLNHLFQECESGAPGKYGEIGQTFSPLALREVGDWISGICRIKK